MVRMVRIVLVVSFVLFIFACSPNNLVLSGNIKNKAVINNNGRLDEIINEIAPSVKYALLIGSDGTAALVTSRSFSVIYIQIDKNEWNSKSEKLPAFCNIRDLNEICVYSRTSNEINNFSERMNDFEFLGQSSKNGHYARKYKERSGE
ncbi:MAG: hypothetical protein PF570_02345 [Candidatus Cloacimonetes bacterium]|jgi:hypothetical protein|nr:hypothetical protein [Candidatus Cloacimonadota bacterium]